MTRRDIAEKLLAFGRTPEQLKEVMRRLDMLTPTMAAWASQEAEPDDIALLLEMLSNKKAKEEAKAWLKNCLSNQQQSN